MELYTLRMAFQIIRLRRTRTRKTVRIARNPIKIFSSDNARRRVGDQTDTEYKILRVKRVKHNLPATLKWAGNGAYQNLSWHFNSREAK